MAEEGKMFVGALSWRTTPETLTAYFSRYGQVVDAIVMVDKVTNQPRGFGFVTFKDPSRIEEVLKYNQHILDDEKIDPKRYNPKEIQMKKREEDRYYTATHKIFVGGLPREATENQVKTYFSAFGEVKEVEFALSKVDMLNKGFGFVTFVDEEPVTKVLKQHFHNICGKKCEVKLAQTREEIHKKNRLFGKAKPNRDHGHIQQEQHWPMQNEFQAPFPKVPMPSMGTYRMPANRANMMPMQQQSVHRGPYPSGYGTYGGYDDHDNHGAPHHGAPNHGVPSRAASMNEKYKNGQATNYYPNNTPQGPNRGHGYAGAGNTARKPGFHPYAKY